MRLPLGTLSLALLLGAAAAGKGKGAYMKTTGGEGRIGLNAVRFGRHRDRSIAQLIQCCHPAFQFLLLNAGVPESSRSSSLPSFKGTWIQAGSISFIGSIHRSTGRVGFKISPSDHVLFQFGLSDSTINDAHATVMEILGQAIDLEAQGHKVCHLEVSLSHQ